MYYLSQIRQSSSIVYCYFSVKVYINFVSEKALPWKVLWLQADILIYCLKMLDSQEAFYTLSFQLKLFLFFQLIFCCQIGGYFLLNSLSISIQVPQQQVLWVSKCHGIACLGIQLIMHHVWNLVAQVYPEKEFQYFFLLISVLKLAFNQNIYYFCFYDFLLSINIMEYILLNSSLFIFFNFGLHLKCKLNGLQQTFCVSANYERNVKIIKRSCIEKSWVQ